jgi:hypothetical protein
MNHAACAGKQGVTRVLASANGLARQQATPETQHEFASWLVVVDFDVGVVHARNSCNETQAKAMPGRCMRVLARAAIERT